MINISSKLKYALKALTELAKHPNAPLGSPIIAQKHTISQNYLEQLLITLKKSGLVTATRGANGGYTLAKHPSEITVLSIIEALEGPIILDDKSDPTTGIFWTQAETELKKVFSVSLFELLLNEQQKETLITYTI